ncbi:hypothetical protein, partial [Proteus mirabilis]|uniref:hypothetical protein n=1 Tax=Proteus mirabilis TaxID=584 RepID=UPI001C12E2DB
RVRAPEFDGSSNDPIEAQGWFKTIENILNLMALTDNKMVRCTSYCLIKDARIWWETVEMKRDIANMT